MRTISGSSLCVQSGHRLPCCTVCAFRTTPAKMAHAIYAGVVRCQNRQKTEGDTVYHIEYMISLLTSLFGVC